MWRVECAETTGSGCPQSAAVVRVVADRQTHPGRHGWHNYRTLVSPTDIMVLEHATRSAAGVYDPRRSHRRRNLDQFMVLADRDQRDRKCAGLAMVWWRIDRRLVSAAGTDSGALRPRLRRRHRTADGTENGLARREAPTLSVPPADEHHPPPDPQPPHGCRTRPARPDHATIGRHRHRSRDPVESAPRPVVARLRAPHSRALHVRQRTVRIHPPPASQSVAPDPPRRAP